MNRKISKPIPFLTYSTHIFNKSQKSFAFSLNRSTQFSKYHHKRHKNQTQQFCLFEFCLKIHTFADLQQLLLKTKVKSQKSFAFCLNKSTKVAKYHHKRQKNQTRQFRLFEFCLKIDTFANLHLLLPQNQAFAVLATKK